MWHLQLFTILTISPPCCPNCVSRKLKAAAKIKRSVKLNMFSLKGSNKNTPNESIWKLINSQVLTFKKWINESPPIFNCHCMHSNLYFVIRCEMHHFQPAVSYITVHHFHCIRWSIILVSLHEWLHCNLPSRESYIYLSETQTRLLIWQFHP